MKKLYLEFFRGAGAVFILSWHIVFLAPTGHPTKFAAYWGMDALMIFFMLSGTVINITQTNKPKPTLPFLHDRLLRIYPLFIAGILLAYLALYLTGKPYPTTATGIGNFLLLSTMSDYMGYIVASIQSNLAVWTLTFEVGFYLLYAATIGRYQKRLMWYWFLIAVICIPLYMIRQERDVLQQILAVLAFSSIWLTGYYIYQYRNWFNADRNAALFCLGILPFISRMHFISNFYDPLKYFILSIFAIPFLRYCLQLPSKGIRIRVGYLMAAHVVIVIAAAVFRYMPLKNTLSYSLLAYIYMGIGYLVHRSGWRSKIIAAVNKAGAMLGRHSYALYITHFPIVFTFSILVHNMVLYVLGILTVVTLVTWLLESKLQPVIVRYFKTKKAPAAVPQDVTAFQLRDTPASLAN